MHKWWLTFMLTTVMFLLFDKHFPTKKRILRKRITIKWKREWEGEDGREVQYHDLPGRAPCRYNTTTNWSFDTTTDRRRTDGCGGEMWGFLADGRLGMFGEDLGLVCFVVRAAWQTNNRNNKGASINSNWTTSTITPGAFLLLSLGSYRFFVCHVYIYDRDINNFKIQKHKNIFWVYFWAKTLTLIAKIWFRVRKVSGTFEKGTFAELWIKL